ncbi:MAG TPA: nucleotidyltransferase family protein [Candidatus Acidoferrum sp.]|nr:nucleotidyltransferase family protein [Candidatus Acidoferrum sp.]
MKAMILAAGLGTRLRPLTDTIPKALVELNGRTLLEITITRLKSFGVAEFIVNVHHHAEKIVSFLESKNNFGVRIELSREDDLLLDTGGGLKKAAWFFLEGNSSEPFFLHNVDVLSSIDLNQMLDAHKNSGALATLAVQQRKSSRQLLFDENNLLVGRRINNVDTLVSGVITEATSKVSCHSERSEESAFSSNSPLATRHSPFASSSVGTPACDSFSPSQLHPASILPGAKSDSHPLAFSGIHVLSPRFLNLITESGVFSIIDTYLRLASSNEKISAFRADSFYWRDLGRLSDLEHASADLRQRDLG